MSDDPATPSAAPESNPSTPPPPKPPSAAVEKMKAASRDSVSAFKLFVTNPAGGLAPAYVSLGDAKALGVGLTFGIVSVICFLLGGYLFLPPFIRQDLFEFLGFGGVMKCLLFAAMPFVCAVAGTTGLRRFLGAQGGLGSDCFIPGAALLPMSLWVVISGLLGYEHPQVIAVLTVFAGCTALLMLYLGYARIMRLSERATTIGIPLVILLTVFVTQSLGKSVLTGPRSNRAPSFDFGGTDFTPPPATGGSISGTYAAKGPDGTTISLTFRSGGRVQLKMTGGGGNEAEEGTYVVQGNVITVVGSDGMTMPLVRNGKKLEQHMGGMTITYERQ